MLFSLSKLPPDPGGGAGGGGGGEAGCAKGCDGTELAPPPPEHPASIALAMTNDKKILGSRALPFEAAAEVPYGLFCFNILIPLSLFRGSTYRA